MKKETRKSLTSPKDIRLPIITYYSIPTNQSAFFTIIYLDLHKETQYFPQTFCIHSNFNTLDTIFTYFYYSMFSN